MCANIPDGHIKLIYYTKETFVSSLWGPVNSQKVPKLLNLGGKKCKINNIEINKGNPSLSLERHQWICPIW